MKPYVKEIVLKPKLDLSSYQQTQSKYSEEIRKNTNKLSSNMSKFQNEQNNKVFNNLKNNLKTSLNSNFSNLANNYTDIDKRLKNAQKLSQISNNFNDLIKGFTSGLGFTSKKEEKDELTENLNALNENLTDLDEKEKESTKDKDDFPKKTNWKDIGNQLGSAMKDKLKDLAESIVESFKDLLKDALDEFDRMSQYNLETSLRINTEAREQALQYGLSSAENYALTRTKERLGITSEEDLLMMTPTQQKEFARLMGEYTADYQAIADKDLFTKYEEYQQAVQEFQDELQMEVIEFFANNKDTIIKVMDFIMKALSKIMDVVTWIGDVLGTNKKRTTEENSAIVSDIVNSYTVSNSKSAQVKIDNNFNGIPITDQSRLSKAGERINEQLIEALDGSLGG